MFIHHYNLKHELLTVLHNVIEDIGKERITVDNGYLKVIKLLFGFDNYLPLDYQSKLLWLSSIAEITYSMVSLEYCCEEEIDELFDLLMEKCYPEGLY